MKKGCISGSCVGGNRLTSQSSPQSILSHRGLNLCFHPWAAKKLEVYLPSMTDQYPCVWCKTCCALLRCAFASVYKRMMNIIGVNFACSHTTMLDYRTVKKKSKGASVTLPQECKEDSLGES